MAHFPFTSDPSIPRYTAIVTVVTEDMDDAAQVLAERLSYDEDYGFPYKLGYDDLQPEESTRGIIIDAPFIRDKLELIMGVIDKSNPDNQRIIDARDKMRSMSDGNLNNLISSINDDHTWELFQEVCNRILNSVIDKVNSSESSS